MKKFSNLLFVIALFGLFAFAQTNMNQQTAFVDSDEIITNMPEYKRAKSEVEAYGVQLQKNLEAKQQKMAEYYQEVMQGAQTGTLSPLQQKEAEEKLTKMQEELQKSAMDADQKLAQKEADLTKPIYEKFEQALKTVAKESGYAYIVERKLFLYSDGGINATQAVKAHLGI